jgi:hypothetical protein
MIMVRYADDLITGFEHHRPKALCRSVPIPVRANPVAVGVVAAAAAVIGPRRRGADRSGAHRRCTDAVAVAAIGAV